MKNQPKTISVLQLKKELLKNKKFKLEYKSQAISRNIIEARLDRKKGKLKPWPA